MMGFDVNRISEMRAALHGRVIKTPVLKLEGCKLSQLLPADANLFMKLELFQHTGSFKARGALLGMDWLEGNARRSGVATFSGGNHALAISWAAAKAQLSAKVIMPKTADPLRIRGCQEMGAEIVLAENMTAAAEMLSELAEKEGRKILHPFNDINMAYGSATCGAEFAEEVPQLDVVILPVGGGGLIAGMAAALRFAHPATRIIGVEPKGANSLSKSFASGRPEKLTQIETIADSLSAPSALADSFELARQHVEKVIEIDDLVMAKTMVEMRDRLNLFVEPACAASLGAALGPLREELQGQKVGVLACGANISAERFAHYTNHV